MKSNYGITLHSWFRANGIIIPSERKLWKLSQELLVDDLESELAPFSFSLKYGGEDLRPAPLVYVADLVAFILHLLDQNARYCTHSVHMPRMCHTFTIYSANRLTWHEGIIPPEEIWVKLSGDKGGESFKMSLQVVNTPHPNSVQNTCVFAAFEASDSVTNLKVALARYHEQVNRLQNESWR